MTLAQKHIADREARQNAGIAAAYTGGPTPDGLGAWKGGIKRRGLDMYKAKPTQFASNKNTPSGRYDPKPVTMEGPQVPHIDTCLVCGTEVPPGPDFCGAECEAKAARLRPQPSEPTTGDFNANKEEN